MRKFLPSLLFGTFALFVRKLGPSIILFVYLTLEHSTFIQKFGTHVAGIPISVIIVLIVILLGIMSILFKTGTDSFSKQLDRKCLPVVDQRVLRFLNKSDLSVMMLRHKSRAILELLKAFLLFFLLICLSALVSPILSFIIVLIMLITIGLSISAGRARHLGKSSNWLSRLWFDPENYSEVVLVLGLIVAYFFMASQSQAGIHTGIMVLVIARFGGTTRKVADHVIRLVIWHNRDRMMWKNKRQKRLKMEAKQIASPT